MQINKTSEINKMKEHILNFVEYCEGINKSPLKIFKQIENYDEVIKYLKETYGEEYSTGSMLYSVINNLDEVPKAACGNPCVFEGLRIRHMCSNYIKNVESSCPECHKYLKELTNQNRKKAVTEKYGVESVSQIKEVREKAANTMLEKYGVDNISKLDSIKQEKHKKHVESLNDENYWYNKSAPYTKNRHDNIMKFLESTEHFELKYISFVRSDEIVFNCKRCGNDFSILNFHDTSKIKCPVCDKSSNTNNG